MGTGNYSATSNYMKLVHWPLMGGLLHLVHRGGDWAGRSLLTANRKCYMGFSKKPFLAPCIGRRSATADLALCPTADLAPRPISMGFSKIVDFCPRQGNADRCYSDFSMFLCRSILTLCSAKVIIVPHRVT